jgi:septum formation inhibitor MinC
MYKIDLPVDTKEAARIIRRKRAEEERKLRIFNPKQRMFGKDLEALRKQIEEKRARDEQDRQLNEAYNQDMCRRDLLGIEIERRLRNDRKRVEQDLQEYRQVNQRYEDRREFDLNDPGYVRNSYPARLHDEDPRCGLASMQRFEGEDLTYKERLNSQAMQRKVWLDYQIKEKRESQQQQAEADAIYTQRLRETDLRNCQLWAAQMQCRRAIHEATCNYNLALAQEMNERKNIEKVAEEEANMAHQINMMQSELLSETTDCTSVGGPFGVARDRFKGFSADKIAAIKEEQRRQILDNRRREREEAEFNCAWDKQKLREETAALILDEEIRSRHRDVRGQMSSTNMELAREQRLRQEYLNRILYTNSPTEDYFAQFNTTTR